MTAVVEASTGWADVAIVALAPVATLVGVFLTLRYQTGLERRDMRRSAYVKWLQWSENLGTWAFLPGANPAEFVESVQNHMAEIELIGSRGVKRAVQSYVDHLGEATSQIAQTADESLPLEEQIGAAGLAFGQAMQPYRDAVVTAMRKDIGVKV